ncbi:MAG: formate dehydrogenase subunit delta [Sphingomonadales bacterium]|jgi:formate dehydrogenase subunit delta|uniref:formate dehydrogenase subunit delta n=1 Tax=Sphingorhabdus sp. TaxID=1902408 RepID=UPI003BB1BFF6|nr:formate dehydrogenase subunit delta [Sphingomonadales bacterium]MBK9432915.1 formate dehydrogenase subunit delta [Sphingomonadales bacterium]MBL0021605.1 formate dehydrogenase subunit delta [Sphingomonadales bacterium]
MAESDARLAYMADQIARNFAIQGEEAAVTATAEHIIAFWDPWMKERALALLDAGGDALTPLARKALERVRA